MHKDLIFSSICQNLILFLMVLLYWTCFKVYLLLLSLLYPPSLSFSLFLSFSTSHHFSYLFIGGSVPGIGELMLPTFAIHTDTSETWYIFFFFSPSFRLLFHFLTSLLCIKDARRRGEERRGRGRCYLV